MDSTTALDVALSYGKVVLEVPAVVDQPLEGDRGSLLRLDLALDVFDGVVGEHVEGHGLVAGHLGGLEEDLDAALRLEQAHTNNGWDTKGARGKDSGGQTAVAQHRLSQDGGQTGFEGACACAGHIYHQDGPSGNIFGLESTRVGASSLSDQTHQKATFKVESVPRSFATKYQKGGGDSSETAWTWSW